VVPLAVSPADSNSRTMVCLPCHCPSSHLRLLVETNSNVEPPSSFSLVCFSRQLGILTRAIPPGGVLESLL